VFVSPCRAGVLREFACLVLIAAVHTRAQAHGASEDEEEWQGVMQALRCYLELHGDLRVPGHFKVPFEDPWPLGTRRVGAGLLRAVSCRPTCTVLHQLLRRGTLTAATSDDLKHLMQLLLTLAFRATCHSCSGVACARGQPAAACAWASGLRLSAARAGALRGAFKEIRGVRPVSFEVLEREVALPRFLSSRNYPVLHVPAP